MNNKPYNRLLLVVIILSISTLSHAGEWRVAPIRLDLSKDSKSGVITVTNDGDAKAQLQISAAEWSQDADGKDVYKETSDIIFFPKVMILDRHEEKVIRTGLKVPPSEREKTYRLFIQEIPEPKKEEGANVAIAIRFGVPIFAMPLKANLKGEIAKIEHSKGILSAAIMNTGNVHFLIDSIFIKGKKKQGEELFSKELKGWYLLNGAARTYTAGLPSDTCKELDEIYIEVKTKEEFKFDGKIDVNKAMCLP